MAIAGAKHPVPFRTRPLSAQALMVLRLKTWESKSPPNLIKSDFSLAMILSPFNTHCFAQLTLCLVNIPNVSAVSKGTVFDLIVLNPLHLSAIK